MSDMMDNTFAAYKEFSSFLPLLNDGIMQKITLETVSVNGDEDNRSTDPDIMSLECFKTEIPPAKIVTDTERDIWDIKSLNCNMRSVSRPSPFLEIFMQNCEQQFEENLQSMNMNIISVNRKTENCIRRACETLQSFLKDFDDTIENWKTLISSGKIPFTAVMMIKHEVLNLNALDYHLKRRKEAIENFYEDILSIENIRVTENVEVLRNANTSLSKLGVKKPAEIRELLEMEILRINQLMLNNVRYYEDLKLNFYLHGEKIRIHLKDYIDKCQKLFAENLLKTIQKRVDELDPDKEFFGSEEGKNALQSLYASQDLITDLIKKQVGYIRFSVEDAEEWTERIQNASEKLDETAKIVISLYKKITYSLFQGRISELKLFLQDYMSVDQPQCSEKNTIMEELKMRVFNSLLSKEEAHKSKISDIEVQWIDLMSDMQTTLQGTFTFLYDSAKIWQRHLLRTKEAKNIINLKLVSAIADHTVVETEQEKDLNIAIDLLRQEATEEKLQFSLQNVYDMLSAIEDQYGKHYAERQLIVEKYTGIMGAEIKLFQTEIETFLDVYPSEYYNDYFVRRQEGTFKIENRNTNETEESEETDLPQELRKCQYQTNALRNWKLGLREAILFYQIVCDKEMESNMRRWIDKQCDSITRNFEAKLALLHARYHRIKTEIYDLRLSELESHSLRFESHVAGVQEQIQDLTEKFQNFQKTISENIFSEFGIKLQYLEEKGKETESTIEVSALIAQAEDMSKTFTSTIETTLQEYLNETSNKISWIQKSNLNYIKSLKLFSDGGNFNPDEVEVLAAEIEKLSHDLESKCSSFQKQASEEEMHWLRAVKTSSEKLLQWFRSIYEDFHFSEKVTITILRVRDFIKKEVKHMKYDHKQLSSKVDVLIAKMPETGGTDIFTFIKECWRPLMNATKNHYKYIVQPLPTSATSSNAQYKQMAGLRFSGFESILFGMSKKMSFRKPHASNSTSLKGFAKLLFDNVNPPISGNSFMEKVCNCMMEVFLSLQDAAMEFYKTRKGSHMFKKDIIKPSLNEFIEETLTRFKYYHVQCEDAWLEEVQGYLSLLERIKNACNAFAEQSILKFHANRTDAVSAAHNIFVRKMEDLNKHNTDIRTFLSKKLKPLYGYPGNKNLLDDLTQEIQCANTSMDKETRDHIMQYTDHLNDRKETYKTDMRSLRNILERLQTALFDSPRFTENLVEQFEEVLEAMHSRTYPPPKFSSIAPFNKRQMTVLEHKFKKQAFKEGDFKEEAKLSSFPSVLSISMSEDSSEKVPQPYRLSIEKSDISFSINPQNPSKSVITAEKSNKQSKDKVGGEPKDESMYEVSEKTEMVTYNIGARVTLSKKEFVDFLKKCEITASKYVSSCSEEGNIWFKLFKKHAEKVKELYTVQCD